MTYRRFRKADLTTRAYSTIENMICAKGSHVTVGEVQDELKLEQLVSNVIATFLAFALLFFYHYELQEGASFISFTSLFVMGFYGLAMLSGWFFHRKDIKPLKELDRDKRVILDLSE